MVRPPPYPGRQLYTGRHVVFPKKSASFFYLVCSIWNPPLLKEIFLFLERLLHNFVGFSRIFFMWVCMYICTVLFYGINYYAFIIVSYFFNNYLLTHGINSMADIFLQVRIVKNTVEIGFILPNLIFRSNAACKVFSALFCLKLKIKLILGEHFQFYCVYYMY